MEKEIQINGEQYVLKSSIKNSKPTTKQIAVLDRGWIVVGDISKSGDYLNIDNASVIRRWGTKLGLGQLAEEGPKPETTLDSCPSCQVHKLSVVMLMNVNEEKW
jgi:hypothetical protein